MRNAKWMTALFLTGGLVLSNLGSCKKDSDPGNNNNNPGTTAENYILFNGVKVKIIDPKIGSLKIMAGDTALQWAGNLPGGSGGDTTLTIIHPVRRVPGSATKLDPQGIAEGEVAISLRWSVLLGQPWPAIVGGDYKLERVNGKWVSTLKNGVGEWTPSGGSKQTFTGIEFRIEWPD